MRRMLVWQRWVLGGWLLVLGLGWTPVGAQESSGRAVWVWGEEGFRLLDDPAYRAEVFEFFDARRIDTLFLLTDPDVFQGGRSVLDEETALEDLIVDIHQRGWSVYALTGADPHLALSGNHAIAIDLADRVFSYNHTHASTQRFDGLVIDVEPWFLPEWEADFPAVAGQFFDLFEAYMALKGQYASSIPVGAAMVSWFDQLEMTWEGSTQPLNQHMQDRLDYVVVQAFRDFAPGDDGIIEQVQSEIAYAEAQGLGIVVGVETQERLGEGGAIAGLATFFQEGEPQLEKSLELAAAAWGSSPAFWQFTIHHLGSYKAWTERAFFHPLEPTGSMVYAAQELLGEVRSDERFIAYPVALQQGQQLAVAVEALDAGLAPTVVVTRSADGRVWEISAAAGGTARLDGVEALDGNHTVTVSGGGSTGPYAIRFRVNAIFEDERFGGLDNGSLSGPAQGLDWAPVTAAPVGPTAASQGDFNGSGRVDISDFFLFVDAFGSSQALFDFDRSGRVDFADFFFFAERFDTAVANFSAWSQPATRAAVAGHLEAGDAVDWYVFEQERAEDMTVLLKAARGDALAFGGNLEMSLYEYDTQALYSGHTVRSDTPFGQGLYVDNLPPGRYAVRVSGTPDTQYEAVFLRGASFVLDPRLRQFLVAPSWALVPLNETPIEFDFRLDEGEEMSVEWAVPQAAAGQFDGASVAVELRRLADNSNAELIESLQTVPLVGEQVGQRLRFKAAFRGRHVLRVLPGDQAGVIALHVERY